MVRRSQSSNPRSVVVLTSGANWGDRAASQKRVSGAGSPSPSQQKAQLKALRRTITALRGAIKAKHRSQARDLLSRARSLVNALPASRTTEERKQLSQLKKKFEAGDKIVVRRIKKPKLIPAAHPIGTEPAATSGLRAAQERKRMPGRDLGDRYINRAALGYAPADEA